MRLRTLGGLRLEGSQLGRPKPLLLLAYLVLEGPKPRRFLAEFFWPEAANPTNSIAVAVRQIRQAAPGALEDDEVRLWADLPCDALELEQALRGRRVDEALGLYRGAFLEGGELAGWGAELEEWVYAKREWLAEGLQELLIVQAEQKATLGDFAQATYWAESALKVVAAPEPTPELWMRLYPVLVAGNSPLAAVARHKAADWQVELRLSAEQARGRLRQVFVGREAELQRLRDLQAGEWAWLRGASGLGKTSLLRQLEGLYLPARVGLPYATLEPLLGDIREGYEGALLQKLASSGGTWLLDDWEQMDAQSRELLHKLRRLGCEARVVLATRQEMPFAADVRLELGPLTARDLLEHPGAYEATGGLPSLVGAWLRGEPLETALEARLAELPPSTQQLYFCLALLEKPDPALARQALGLDAAALAMGLDELLAQGLIEPSGLVRGRETALLALDTQPTQGANLCLQLARQLSGAAGMPFYRKAKALWEPADLPGVERAYREWAKEVLRRGFPAQAAQALEEAPPSAELQFLRARALERSGQYKEALQALEPASETPEVMALRGALLWRLGRPEEARRAAEMALEGGEEARAEALNTLGSLAFSTGKYEEAEKQFRRAATVWLSLNERERWAGALNNQAMARSELGQDTENAFYEALSAAGNHPAMRSLVLLSLGRVDERRGNTESAKDLYQQAAQLAQQAGARASAARAWNNLGALYHRQGLMDNAKQAYTTALELAQPVGERLLLGTILANLAELTEDREAFEEALHLFEQAGHQFMLERYRAEYQSFIERSLGNSHA